MSVSTSKGNDCRVGSTLLVEVNDLQEMHNHLREQTDSGLKSLADNSGKGGLPPAPDTGTSPGEVPPAPADPNVNSALQSQQQTPIRPKHKSSKRPRKARKTSDQRKTRERLMEYLDHKCIEMIPTETFQRQRPYPWINMHNTLTPEGFERLRETLPNVSLFDRQVGIKRAYGQGSHDRYLLHYQPGLELAEPWRDFVAELNGETYLSFLNRMFGPQRFILTLEWYYAWQGCAVSPHCDAQRKLATHIFYFNTDADWESSWRGTSSFSTMEDGSNLIPLRHSTT